MEKDPASRIKDSDFNGCDGCIHGDYFRRGQICPTVMKGLCDVYHLSDEAGGGAQLVARPSLAQEYADRAAHQKTEQVQVSSEYL